MINCTYEVLSFLLTVLFFFLFPVLSLLLASCPVSIFSFLVLRRRVTFRFNADAPSRICSPIYGSAEAQHARLCYNLLLRMPDKESENGNKGAIRSA